MGIRFVKKRPLEKRHVEHICATTYEPVSNTIATPATEVVNKEQKDEGIVNIIIENNDINDTEKTVEQKNKKKKTQKTMDKDEKIQAAEEIINAMKQQEVKVVKKDKGLIERTESSKIILTEDNRQVLND